MSYQIRRRMLWTLFAIGLGLLAVAANATTLARMSFDELTRQATAIVRARCVNSRSSWRNGEIWTEMEFDVTEVSKGTAPGILRIALPGGKVAHIQSRIDGLPRFQAGDEVYLFLWDAPGRGTSMLGWAQGTFRIDRDTRTGMERVTQDSAALPVFDPLTKQFRHGGVRNLPLPVFQLKLKRSLEKLNR